MRKVFFNYADVELSSLRDRKKIKNHIALLFEREGFALDTLNYVFCSDNYLLKINRQFLNHDEYTDIITFDLSANPKASKRGEIYISTERVKENAQKFNIPFKQEILRVLFHGALHLCGYKDKTQKHIVEIRKKEDLYLALAKNF